MKYICIKTFVSNHGNFRRFYYGEEIKHETYLMLSQLDQAHFVKLFNENK